MKAVECTPMPDFDAWAALSARLLSLSMDERIDILDQRGIDPKDWAATDDHYFAQIGSDIAAGRMDRAEQYGRACAAEMERRRRGEPDESAPPAPVEAKAEPAAAPGAVGAPAVASVEEAPSYLREPPPTGASPGRSPSPLAGTMAAPDLPSFIKQAAGKLPFGATPSPEFVASLDATKPLASGSGGATVALGVDLMALAQAALPFAKQEGQGNHMAGGKATGFPRLPLQSYASLCAELSVSPERRADILPKYGIKSDEAHRALDEDWRARLTAHADTREEWERHRAMYEAWLRKGSR